MLGNLGEFIGVQRISKTKADRKLESIIKDIFVSMEKMLCIDLKEYETIQKLIEEKRKANNEQSYFWDWMNENGLAKLKNLLSINLPDEEELHDLLDYRDMILQLDIENNIVDSYFMSIADTLNELNELNQGLSEQAATFEQEDFIQKVLNDSIEYHISRSTISEKQRWIVNNDKSPTGKSGTFVILYC